MTEELNDAKQQNSSWLKLFHWLKSVKPNQSNCFDAKMEVVNVKGAKVTLVVLQW